MSQLPFIVLLRTLNGLAGPLHGLASQEVLLWINSVMEDTEEWKVVVIREKLAELYEFEQQWSRAAQMLNRIDLDSGIE
uniref:Uncharacterized protein n=1 Tax=Aegilops tauschii subsp. strangulata TaxID=200361 RepID=A0A453GFU8_AEGTS